jgi:hypothetical protein
MYENGKGVPLDYAKAMEWYMRASDRNAYAQLGIARLYRSGFGIQADDSVAATWVKKAADQGLVEAQNMLGGMYLDGSGVAKDPAEAIRWFRRAADGGNALAQYGLGLLYYQGIGAKPDHALALSWFKKAAAQGSEEAKAALAGLDARKAKTSMDTAGKVPPALEFRCVLDARVPTAYAGDSPQMIEAKYVGCLRSNWKRLFGLAPFCGELGHRGRRNRYGRKDNRKTYRTLSLARPHSALSMLTFRQPVPSQSCRCLAR